MTETLTREDLSFLDAIVASAIEQCRKALGTPTAAVSAAGIMSAVYGTVTSA